MPVTGTTPLPLADHVPVTVPALVCWRDGADLNRVCESSRFYSPVRLPTVTGRVSLNVSRL